ncbi:MAG: zinc ABC transporter substrate-binding protein [Gammaproteobacteria bacterium]|nr:zinc ABC transporter substrate-binding protein [Gammaproteobacteria bacterium]
MVYHNTDVRPNSPRCAMYKPVTSLVIALLISGHAAADVDVATTVRPLQFIIEAIVGNSGTVTAVIDQNDSPHQYTVSPSDRTSLAQADLLVWIGPDLEVFLADVFSRRAERGEVLNVSTIVGLQLITSNNNQLDPHLWLDSGNAVLIAEAFTDRASNLDPANALSYRENFTRFASEIAALRNSIDAMFSAPVNSNYLVYHDAYQYFESQFGIRHGLVLLDNPEIQPSMRQVLALRSSIQELQPNCLLMEADSSRSLVSTLLEGRVVQMETIDLLGNRLSGSIAKVDRYAQLLSNVAEGIASCVYQTGTN